MLTNGLLLAAIVVPLIGGCATLPAPSQEAKAALAPTGVLRVGIFTGNPVIGSRQAATGELTGPTATLGRALAESAGVPVRLIEYTAVSKLVEDAATGAWDIGVVSFDPARQGILDFAPPHLVVDLTYMVPAGSAIRGVADIDRPGVRIAAARGAATTLFLERALKQARVEPAANETAAFALIRDGNAEAYAQNRFMLLGLAEGLPGARVLDERFAESQMCIILPKGRAAALAYVGAFVEQAKQSGLVARAIEAAALRGVSVAPAAK